MTPEVAVVITVTISEHLILQNMVQNYSYELSYLILKKKKTFYHMCYPSFTCGKIELSTQVLTVSYRSRI